MRFLLLLIISGARVVCGQACTNSGSGPVCVPAFFRTAAVAKTSAGAAADGSWALLNHAADHASGDLGCFASSQVKPAFHNATITMIEGNFTCGQSNTPARTERYLSGALVIGNLSYLPADAGSGHIAFEAKIQAGRGWPAFWLLGGHGDTSSSSGCQYSTIHHSWGNVDRCKWSSDADDSAEVDIMEMTEAGGYTNETQHVFMNGAKSGHTGQPVSDATTHFHVYRLDWSASRECWSADGVSGGCATDLVPRHPMFFMIENRVDHSKVPPASAFPTTMTIQYVQVCNGEKCTAPDSVGGNTLFLDDFGTATRNTVPDRRK